MVCESYGTGRVCKGDVIFILKQENETWEFESKRNDVYIWGKKKNPTAILKHQNVPSLKDWSEVKAHLALGAAIKEAGLIKTLERLGVLQDIVY